MNKLTNSLVLIYLIILASLINMQQAIANVAGEEHLNSTVVIEPTLPPLGDASLYLPLEKAASSKHSESLVIKLRDTRLIVKLHQRRVYIYHGKQLQASYPIAIGKAGWATPTGKFKIIDMQQNPAWQHPLTGKIVPPGGDNPLGTRWIGFWTDGQNFVGFHGTPQEELVGQAVSHGCLRMRNQDVLALYNLVNIGTPVLVEP